MLLKLGKGVHLSLLFIFAQKAAAEAAIVNVLPVHLKDASFWTKYALNKCTIFLFY